MIVAFIVFAFINILLGGLVWKFRVLQLTSTYNLDRVTDEKGLARWVGLNLIIIGLLSIIIAFLCINFYARIYPWIIVLLTIFIAIRTVAGTKKY